VSIEIVMPRLSDTMEEGTILRWLKREGESVTAGEVIAEVETDKADMELEASASGTLAAIKVAEGESVAVGVVLALLDDGGGQGAGAGAADDGSGAAGHGTEGERTASSSAAVRVPERSSAGTSRTREAGDAVKSSPAARQLAEEHHIDLRDVRASGPGGRVVKEDVVAAVEAGAGNKAAPGVRAARDDGDTPRQRDGAATRAAAPKDGVADVPARATRRAPAREQDVGRGARIAERHELSRMRQSIARRMSESFREVPHFAVTAEIDMTEAVRMRESLKASEVYATTPTYTHLVLRATALALRRHPRLNASYADDAMVIHADVNIGMAVAVEDGLIVPILRHADERSLEELAVEARRLAEQATQGRFARDDLSGGTFTVSNLGMFDIESFTAVINPPQAGILAVGAIKERAVVRAGQLAVARTMLVTLSCDHRIVDGAVASRFLEELKQLLEHPIVLVVHGR
jgi:pyruvate dehydrogenase E2 component (dihydrolipoamide acetyltransferase)